MATDRALGIDVSLWQDNNSTPQMVDFDKAKLAGASFVFIKASQAQYLDPDFVMNWQNAGNSKMLRGAYHFLDFKNKPANKTPIQWASDQAAFFWGTMRNLKSELPLVVDYEDAGSLSAAELKAALKQFLEVYFALTKTRLMLYTSRGFWTAYGSNDAYWLQYPLWIAQYYYEALPANPTLPQPFTKWLFWQYLEKGDGVKYGCESKYVDLNLFNGTVTQLYQYAHVPLPPPLDPVKVARMGEMDYMQNYVDHRRVEIMPTTPPAPGDPVLAARMNEMDRLQAEITKRKQVIEAS
jgi:lysozyme